MICEITHQDILIKGVKVFENEINEQNHLVELLKGKWVEIVDKKNIIVGNQYVGINEFTNKIEMYNNIFLISIERDKKDAFNAIDQYIDNIVVSSTDIDRIYFNFFVNDMNDREMIKSLDNVRIMELSSVFIKKELRTRPEIKKNDKIQVRKATDRDIPNIVNCLKQAFLNGNPDVKTSEEEKTLMEMVEFKYTPLLTENRISLVGEINGQFCGHCTYGFVEKEAQLIDILVIDEYGNQGISQVLASHGEASCYDIGIQEIKGTVEDNQNIEALLNSLSKAGWNPYSYVYSKKMK